MVHVASLVSFDIVLYLCLSAPYYLIFWPEEDSVSVVTSSSVIGGDVNTLDLGTKRQVKQGSKLFSGKVAASGEIFFIPFSYYMHR